MNGKSPLQRYVPALAASGEPELRYDMHGDWVRFDQHLKALNTERALAEDRVLEAQKSARADKKPAENGPPRSPHGAARAARDQILEAVKVFRELGWDDGDIIFAAELELGPPSVSLASTPPNQPSSSPVLEEGERPKTCPTCGSQFPAVIAGPCAEDGKDSDPWHVEGLEAMGRGCEECENGIYREGGEWSPCGHCFPVPASSQENNQEGEGR